MRANQTLIRRGAGWSAVALMLLASCGANKDEPRCTAKTMLKTHNRDELRMCERECVDGHADACSLAAGGYFATEEFGNAGLLIGLTYYWRACDLGDRSSCNLLAGTFAAGLVVAWNPETAKQLYERACDLGDDVACTSANASPTKPPRPMPKIAADASQLPACAQPAQRHPQCEHPFPPTWKKEDQAAASSPTAP